MRDVAALAGVTIGTVSHVINGTANVSPGTADRVNQAIRELNYHPNQHAQALRKPTARQIGYLVPDITTNFYSNFFSSFVRYAYEAAFSVSAINFRHNPDYEITEIRNLVEKNVDAILLHNGFDDNEGLEIIKSAGIPLILLDRHQEGFSYISFDNTTTVRKLISMLKRSGYTKIGYVSESILIQNLNDRYIGYILGMQENGLESDLKNILINPKPEVDTLTIGYQLMKERLSSQTSLPDVFVCSSDLMAFGAMRAIREAGLRIPEDISITGYDNLPVSNFMEPPLTTIDQNFALMAQHAWQMLQKLLAGKSDNILTETLTQALVVRTSAIIPEEVLKNSSFNSFI